MFNYNYKFVSSRTSTFQQICVKAKEMGALGAMRLEHHPGGEVKGLERKKVPLATIAALYEAMCK